MISKETLKKIVTSQNIKETVKETGVNYASVIMVRFNYKRFLNGASMKGNRLYTHMIELKNEGVALSDLSSKTRIQTVPNGVRKEIVKSVDIDRAFDEFKQSVVAFVAQTVKDISQAKIDEAYRKGKAEGALEVQAKFIEEAKNQNIGDMIKKSLMGAFKSA